MLYVIKGNYSTFFIELTFRPYIRTTMFIDYTSPKVKRGAIKHGQLNTKTIKLETFKHSNGIKLHDIKIIIIINT